MILTIEEFRASRIEGDDGFYYGVNECEIGKRGNAYSLIIGNLEWHGLASPEYLARLESIIYLTHYLPEHGKMLTGDSVDSYVRDVCEALGYECNGDAFGLAFASVDYPISAGEALDLIQETVRTYKLSPSARHAAWFDDTRKRWLSTVSGKTLAAMGFDLVGTGGGCTALDSEPENGWHIRVTDSDGSGHMVDGDSDFWLVGAHSDDGEMYSSECAEARTFTELLAAIKAHRLALRFAAFVRHDIGEAHFPDVRRENVKHVGTGICATGDYCDSNMSMLAAWRDVLRRDFNMESADDLALWNRAWTIAKAEYLSGSDNVVPAVAYPDSLASDDWTPESMWPVETVTESPVEIFSNETVDISPTWESILPVLTVALVDGTEEGKRLARIELQRMAKVADMAKGAALDDGERETVRELLYLDFKLQREGGSLDADDLEQLRATFSAIAAKLGLGEFE